MGDFLKCGECDEVFELAEAGEAVYECSRCSQTQIGERRCENCNIFMAKIGDISCPYCEAPEEMLSDSTEKEAIERMDKKQEEAIAAERARPAQEQEREKEMEEWRKKSAAESAPWEGDDSLGRALDDIPADHAHAVGGESLGGKWDWYFGPGSSSGIGISRDEATRVCKKILALESEVRILKNDRDVLTGKE